MKNNEGYMEIDLLRLVYALMHKAWAIILAAIIFGGCAFAYTQFMVTPMYKARTLMYVNNNDISVGGAQVSISQADLAASQKLVATYIVILETRSTLNEVIQKANVPYTYEQMVGMVSANAVNSTEIFYVDVIGPNPKEAERIANTIGQVLPEKISSIVEGSSARIVDYAVEPSVPCSPNVTKNIVLGMLLGILLSSGVIIVLELMDDQIHDTDYLLNTYELPVLAVVPDLQSSSKNKSGYYQNSYAEANKKL